jgi:membrane-associated phospholipid phosphatase
MFGGYVPTVELQQWFWTGSVHWYDHLLLDVSKLHFVIPPLFAFVLWMKRRSLFFRFSAAMLALSFAAALTFVLFPAAPPWAAGRTLLTPTVTKIDDSSWTSVSNSFSLSKIIEGNPYAAIPSLHAGYAMLCFLFVAWLVWRKSWRWYVIVPAAVYPLALSFARVYSGDHYVIDLLAGYLYAVAVFMLVGWYWRRHELPE